MKPFTYKRRNLKGSDQYEMIKCLNDSCYSSPIFYLYLLIINHLAGMAGQQRESPELESIAIKNNQALGVPVVAQWT